MATASLKTNPEEPDDHLLLKALVSAVVIHLLLFCCYQMFGSALLKPRMMPLLAQKLKPIPPPKPKEPPKEQQEVPMMFVDVDPQAITQEAPKAAKYYSSKNSQAANTQETKESNDPRITGDQKLVPKTVDGEKTHSSPLQPSAPKTPQPDQPVEKEVSKPAATGGKPVGDLAMAKPSEHPGEDKNSDSKEVNDSVKPTHKRANTLVEAKMRQEALSGHKMAQEGGVKRHLSFDSLDTRATAFGEYDRQLIEAIQSRWYDLLDSKDFSRDRTGLVVVEFNLNSDGRITDVKILDNNVGDVLGYVCQRAITDPAPFAPWPADMRRVLGTDKRDVRFTFYYE